MCRCTRLRAVTGTGGYWNSLASESTIPMTMLYVSTKKMTDAMRKKTAAPPSELAGSAKRGVGRLMRRRKSPNCPAVLDPPLDLPLDPIATGGRKRALPGPCVGGWVGGGAAATSRRVCWTGALAGDLTGAAVAGGVVAGAALVSVALVGGVAGRGTGVVSWLC